MYVLGVRLGEEAVVMERKGAVGLISRRGVDRGEKSRTCYRVLLVPSRWMWSQSHRHVHSLHILPHDDVLPIISACTSRRLASRHDGGHRGLRYC